MPDGSGAGLRTVEELPLLLTVEEAASVLRIGRNTAYIAVADGSLPSIRVGSRIRIPRAALAELMALGIRREQGRAASVRGVPDVSESV